MLLWCPFDTDVKQALKCNVLLWALNGNACWNTLLILFVNIYLIEEIHTKDTHFIMLNTVTLTHSIDIRIYRIKDIKIHRWEINNRHLHENVMTHESSSPSNYGFYCKLMMQKCFQGNTFCNVTVINHFNNDFPTIKKIK